MSKIQEAILKSQLTKLIKQKNYSHAGHVCSQIIRVNPKDVSTWFIFGQLQEKLNRPEYAVKAFLKASQPKSEFTIKALKLGIDISIKSQFYALGFMATQELVKYESNVAESLYTHGVFGAALNLDHLASVYFEKAITIKEKEKKYHTAYAKALNHLGKTAQALKQYNTVKELDDSDDEPFFRANFAQNYSFELDEQEIFNAHQDFGKRLENRTINIKKFKKRSKSSRVKIAYVSKDFVMHSVSYFFLAIIKSHNAEQFEVYCYSDCDTASADEVTEKIKRYSEHWVNSSDMSDEILYRKIREDEIDILVDLQGLTGKTRMGVYAKKAAPVQINYLGYPNTSGLSRIDYRIVDNWTDPKGLTEKHNTETLIRLPSGFLCYTPELPKTLVTKLPALSDLKFTFGSFNVFPKITSPILSAWAKILIRVPGSQILIKNKYFNEKQNIHQIEQFFDSHGINKNRLLLQTPTPDMKSHLETYNQVDIHLDTFPYNGTTTTCEALWQGVPTVTLAGKTHRSRVGCSILEQVGLQEFIASTFDEYINIAVSTANELNKLDNLRTGMRHRLNSSALMNAKLFINELETEYLKLYSDI